MVLFGLFRRHKSNEIHLHAHSLLLYLAPQYKNQPGKSFRTKITKIRRPHILRNHHHVRHANLPMHMNPWIRMSLTAIAPVVKFTLVVFLE
jgi:hypothetical protein